MSQKTILHITFRKKIAIWPGIIQKPVNAGSRGIGMKTAKLGVGYRPHHKSYKQ